MLATPIGRLRLLGWLEGLSYIFLLFVAMPLKYMAGQPLAVKISGSAHGLFFVLFVLALSYVHFNHDWPFKRSLGVFVASLLPFGTFVIDRRMHTWETTSPEV
jgi:integral membrane protein